MFSLSRIVPVFAAFIALVGCAGGTVEIKAKPAAPSTVIIEQESPATVSRDRTKIETKSYGGGALKTTETTEIKTTN